MRNCKLKFLFHLFVSVRRKIARYLCIKLPCNKLDGPIQTLMGWRRVGAKVGVGGC